jgi:protein-L-isoaspartate(D-aspartate) O-methyltransferase
MASARSRTRLVKRLGDLGISDERVLAAMRRVPRHMFVDEAMSSRAYDDTALPIGYGQTISQPYIVAEMTRLLLADGTPQKVLEIGTGSGYQAAVLAELVATVYSVERIAALYDLARRRLAELGYRNVHVRQADPDVFGLPSYGPFDAILVTAGAEELPESLCEQLAEGGRMIIPVGAVNQTQRLIRVHRQGDNFVRDELAAVSFVPLVAGEE